MSILARSYRLAHTTAVGSLSSASSSATAVRLAPRAVCTVPRSAAAFSSLAATAARPAMVHSRSCGCARCTCARCSCARCVAAVSSHPRSCLCCSGGVRGATRSFSSFVAPPQRATKLTGAALDGSLAGLVGWSKRSDSALISKSFVFDDFNACFGVMSRVALLAEKMNHHPKWTNVYNQLEVQLETHDVNGISDMDIYMAKQIDLYVAAAKKN